MLEEIYGKEAIEALINKKKIEDSYNFRIQKENIDPRGYMRKIVEERYNRFKQWYDKRKSTLELLR